MKQRRSTSANSIGSTFALWMIIILVFLIIAMFVLRSNRSEPAPLVVPISMCARS
jgi:hypothetical protein